ncbi:MAG: Uma2 family endonuclease [Planctomycetes bacterium]|nr:Uma2 family endonuclease [Planctomycetota bacterium]
MKPAVIHGRTVLTYEDYREFPDDGYRHQLIGGRHHVTPAPVPHHQTVVLHIGAILMTHVRRYDLGRVYVSPIDVVLTRADVVQPDVVFVAKERLGIVGPSFIEGAPDLVVEVLSRSTRQIDLGLKRSVYEREGVRAYWVADPVDRSLTGFALDAEGRYGPGRTVRGDRPFSGRPFPRLRIRLAEVFEP